MTSSAKIRLGAAIVMAGELFALVTMWRPVAWAFVAFVFAASLVILLGAAVGTWGVLQEECAPGEHARRGEEVPRRHVRRDE